MSCLLLIGLLFMQDAKAEAKADLLSFPRPKPAEPVDAATLNRAIDRGIQFLIKDQNADGSFGSPTRTKDLNIYAPVPGAHHAFTAATTAMGITALIDAGERGTLAREALEKAERFLLENLPKVKRATPDAIYNIWAHAYAIQALVRMHRRLPDDKARQKKIEELIRLQFDYLDRYESVDGGWGYYDFKLGSKKPATDSTSFTTAAVLVALREAADLGVTPPEKLVRRAVASIHRQQKPDFTYLYGEYLKWMPMMGINTPGGSLGRSQACNIALKMWDDQRITDLVLTCWLNRLISQNMWLDLGRKRPIPHESKLQVAGYFYYFGHYYAGYCIQALPQKERAFYQDHLARILLDRQEQDGSWFDYPLYNYGHAYGTAYAVSTLMMCNKKEAAADPQELNMTLIRSVGTVPLQEPTSGHAHNDYLHARPLAHALELGYASIEVDVHLKEGELLVGHDDWQLTKGRTLEKLYLEPLAARVKANGGRVYPNRAEPLLLLIDLKTDGATTYAAVHDRLGRFAFLLSEFSNGTVTPRAVQVVISGNVPREIIKDQSRRWAGIDGRLTDLDSAWPTSLMPLLSDHWGRHFKWKGDGAMPAEERTKLLDLVAKAHQRGRKLRFWATPERESVWHELAAAGVDFIGTDHLQRLHDFLAKRGPAAATSPARLELKDGDRVLLLGATLLERDRHHGELELMFRSCFPGRAFTVRNLSWPGDTTQVQLRPLNFGPLEKHLAEVKPTVAFLSFGMSEAEAGPAGIPSFLDGYRSLLAKVKQHTHQVVLIAPHNREALPGSGLPDPTEFNTGLAAYVSAVKELAGVEGCRFVSLFDTFVPTRPEAPRVTENGLHLSREGYRLAAGQIAVQLGWTPQPIDREATREEILRKEELFFNRWRAHNGEYIYGRRAAAGGGNAGNPSFANEFAQFEKLLAEADARITRTAARTTKP